MKKIYISFFAMVLSGAMFAQNAFSPKTHLEKGKLAPNTKIPAKINNSNRAGGPFSQWFEPVGDVMTQKGLLLDGTSSADQDWFLSTVYIDSTVKVSSPSSTRFYDVMFLGSVLDLKSTNLLPSFEPVITKFNPYTIDSIQIVGSYVKVTPDVDTLYVTVVWGDTTNTSVWSRRTTATTWNPPISTWRPTVIGPKVSGFAAAPGNLVQASAPSTNKLLIKYALTNSDSSESGRSKVINIPLPAPINIPAGNIAACMYTFAPGGAHTTGDVAYHFTGGASAQTVNGFAGLVWGQQNPAVNSITDYVDHQVDLTSFNMGLIYFNDQRHANAGTFNSFLLGDLTTAPLIQYKVSGVSTVGVNELNNDVFSLGQNIPNPFTNQTKINYQIKTAAKSVAFEVYNVAGVKMLTKAQSNVNAGAYSIELNDMDFANGIYFYSLTVDGNKITKKMIVSK